MAPIDLPPRPVAWRRLLASGLPLLAALALGAAAARAPATVEWYARKVFPGTSAALGPMSAALPMSPTELCLGLLAPYTLAQLIGLLRVGATSRATRVARLLLLAGALAAWFMHWGVLYHRPPVEERWGLDLARADEAALRRLAQAAVTRANRDAPARPDDLTTENARLSGLVAAVFEQREGHRPVLRSPTRVPWLSPALDALGIEGISSPFFREALLNGQLEPPLRAAVHAHELAHLAGSAHEGEASLVGLLACWTSPAPQDRYSAALTVLLHLGRLELEPGRRALDALDERPRRDIEAERARQRARSGLLVAAQRALNDTYLRTAGDARGVASYDRATRLLAAALPETDR